MDILHFNKVIEKLLKFTLKMFQTRINPIKIYVAEFLEDQHITLSVN